MSDITELFGADAHLGSKAADIYPTSCPNYNIQLGGGYYSGKIYEIFGEPSHGKSTLALDATICFTNFCEQHKITKYAVLWIETESAFDKMRALWIGAKIDKFIIREAESVEEGFLLIEETLKKCRDKGYRLFIVWDTIAAAPTQNEKDAKGMYAGGISEKPRIIRYYMKRLTHDLGATDSTFIIVNQVSAVIGSYSGETDTPGGYGIKFHASTRIQVRKVGTITGVDPKSGADVCKGIISETYTKKNKLALPYQSTQLVIYNEEGLQPLDTILNTLKTLKVLKTGGGGYVSVTFKGKDYKWQQVKRLKEIIETQEPELLDYLHYLIYDAYKETSPFTKVRIFPILAAYELRFLGAVQTTLTDREQELANLIEEDLDKEDILDKHALKKLDREDGD